jgi:hypothetical protein
MLTGLALYKRESIMKKLILIIAMALVSSGTWGGYLSMGVGTKSCRTFVSDRQAANKSYYSTLNWVSGFITGGNVEREKRGDNSDIGEGIDFESTALWLDNYCRANPSKNLGNAADMFVQELMSKE